MSRIAPRKGGPSSSNVRLGHVASGASRKTGQRVGTDGKGADEGYLYVAGVRDPSKRVTEYRTDQDVCPICHTDRQFKKNLRLLVSPCYHKMCESCIDRLFTLGPEPCPQCGRILRKINFAHQTFEDLKVEKEVSVRKRMAEHFNKRREDFGSDKEYDDYLEMVEDWTFNLLNDIDVPATEARISAFTNQNASLIAANQEKLRLESMSQKDRDDLERRAREEKMRMIEEAERVEREADERVKDEVTNALASGDTARAREIELGAREAKRRRADALFEFVPPSMVLEQADGENKVKHSPLSPSYDGPYVAIPYADPDTVPSRGWYQIQEDYVDGRPGVIFAREDRDHKVRGGGWDLQLFWEMEIRSAVEGLAIEPLV